jgi:hypothetical protein
MSTNTVPPSPLQRKLESESLEAKSESKGSSEKAVRKVKQSSVEINHLNTHQEFERQVHGRMAMVGATCSLTTFIDVDSDTFKKLEIR